MFLDSLVDCDIAPGRRQVFSKWVERYSAFSGSSYSKKLTVARHSVITFLRSLQAGWHRRTSELPGNFQLVNGLTVSKSALNGPVSGATGFASAVEGRFVQSSGKRCEVAGTQALAKPGTSESEEQDSLHFRGGH